MQKSRRRSSLDVNNAFDAAPKSRGSWHIAQAWNPMQEPLILCLHPLLKGCEAWPCVIPFVAFCPDPKNASPFPYTGVQKVLEFFGTRKLGKRV